MDAPRRTDTELDGRLSAISATSDSVGADLATLPVADWDRPTNCPPWRVRDLAVHLAVGGGSFVVSVRRGLAGAWRSMHLRGRTPVATARRLWPTSVDAVDDEERRGR